LGLNFISTRICNTVCYRFPANCLQVSVQDLAQDVSDLRELVDDLAGNVLLVGGQAVEALLLLMMMLVMNLFDIVVVGRGLGK